MLRAVLYGHAFNARRRPGAPGPDTASALAWVERASLPVSQLGDPRVIRAALDGLCTRPDGSPAAANTITRKRAVFHGALGYAVELGLLPANPFGLVRWRAPRAAVAVSPAAVASPAQVRAILAQVARIRPELAAFFGCLYYAALRPEEAIVLRPDDLILPARGRGKIILTAACPRTGSAWTNTGNSHEPTGLKHRPGGAIRVVPIPPVLVSMLCRHLGEHGTTPDGRLFRGARGGMLSESVYGRVWHAARRAAPGPDLAATALARRPYDLRHAALSLWLNASGAPAEVAARAGNSARVLHAVYLHAPTAKKTPSASGSKTPLTQAPASRIRHHARKRAVIRTVGTSPDPVRYMYANQPEVPRIAHPSPARQPPQRDTEAPAPVRVPAVQKGISTVPGPILADGRIQPTHSPRTQPTVCVTAPFTRKSR